LSGGSIARSVGPSALPRVDQCAKSKAVIESGKAAKDANAEKGVLGYHRMGDRPKKGQPEAKFFTKMTRMRHFVSKIILGELVQLSGLVILGAGVVCEIILGANFWLQTITVGSVVFAIGCKLKGR
jgi:hypothetical protein